MLMRGGWAMEDRAWKVGRSGWRLVLTSFLTLALVVVLAFGFAGTARASGAEVELEAERTGLEVIPVDDDTVRVRFDSQIMTVRVDQEAQQAHVLNEDGTSATVNISGIPSTASLQSVDSGDVTVASAGSTTCTMLLWGIGLIHQSGWTVAIGIMAAAGPAGAAAAALAYSIGVSAFFAYVSTRC